MTSSRRVRFFTGEPTDPRYGGGFTGDERSMLASFLRAQRETLELKCRGLEKELDQRSVEPSVLSLLGLVRHLTDVERRWFRKDMAGLDVALLYATPDNPDEDFDGAVAEPGAVAAAWEAWRAEVAFAEKFVEEAAGLDVEGQDSWLGAVSLRWVLLHMIEEYARHNGHADLLRERIDGAVGL
ncbi:DinB family protein [Streptomyces sp. NPDC093510]|uniref:DinB family protein n=1 Tax=Streptomyces sp. NPDC093510 TaxID=3155199 RepID=UPI003448AC33